MTEKKKTACREGTPASGKDGKDVENLAVCGQYNTKRRNNRQVAEFGVYFRNVQTDLQALSASLAKIRERDAALMDKLTAALRSVLKPYVEG